jgi:beta-fructofuranosidase
MLRFADRWIWDFWLAQTETAYHIFFLQAPKTLGDPNLWASLAVRMSR